MINNKKKLNYIDIVKLLILCGRLEVVQISLLSSSTYQYSLIDFYHFSIFNRLDKPRRQYLISPLISLIRCCLIDFIIYCIIMTHHLLLSHWFLLNPIMPIYIWLYLDYDTFCVCSNWFKSPEAKFKKFDPRLKFMTRLKYGWFHLKLY